jgi:hypothetical protein
VTVEFNDVDVMLIQTRDCAGARVRVHFNQLEITSVDPNACAMTVDFFAGSKMVNWTPSTKPEPGTFTINRTLEVILNEETPLKVSAVGRYANICQLFNMYGGNLGTFNSQFPASMRWGEGTQQTRVTIPFDITYHYTIQADWLP